MLRVNVGCGATPTEGWLNYDNSISVRIGATLGLSFLRFLLPKNSAEFARKAREGGVQWADSRRLPLADRSADVVYSSHMLEHMAQTDALLFLREARRVLVPGGALRIAVPDLRPKVLEYLKSGDADELIRSMHVSPESGTRTNRLVQLLAGTRHHVWMYDGASLVRLISSAGFMEAAVVPPGTSRIDRPGPLDLAERSEESVYVESTAP
jgi:SAM-dependent methyltransferase